MPVQPVQPVQPAPAAPAMRECDSCHAVDTLPHHQVVVQDEDGLVVVSRHFGCCIADGCPDGTCIPIVNGATAGV